MNLASKLVETTNTHADRVAVRLDGAATTFRELDQASARAAGVLQDRGVKPGDRVAIMLPNLPAFAVLYYGILRAGGVVVPMNPLLKAREVGYYLGDSGAGLIFAWQAVADEAGQGALSAEADVIGVDQATFARLPGRRESRRRGRRPGYGRHCGDPLHLGHDWAAEGRRTDTRQPRPERGSSMRRPAALDARRCDLRWLPLFHSFGQTCTLNAAVASGACLTLLPRFDPQQALQSLAEHRATIFAGVPTMYGALLAQADRAAYDVSALRVCISGGSAMPVELLRGFEHEFGCKVLRGYGLSETSPVASFNHPDRERKPGSIGTPIRGVEMRVVDEYGEDVPQGEVGEIVIRGHNVMKGIGSGRRRQPRQSRTGGSAAATWGAWTRTAITRSSTGRRT
jgi:long-chain acyl-CoA synthetase